MRSWRAARFGRVAELVDHRLHAGQRLGAEQLGVVQRVGDRLPGDAGRSATVASVGGVCGVLRRHGRSLPRLDRLGSAGRLGHGSPQSRGSFQTIVHRRRRTPDLSVHSPSVRPMATRVQPAGDRTTAPSAAGRPAKWVGRCGECQAWGTVVEVGRAQARAVAGRSGHARPPGPSARSPIEDSRAPPTGVGELDRVLGGGLVPGRRDPAGRRARRGQVDAAARGRRPDCARPAAACSTSPARSPRPRCGCAPSAPAPSHDSSSSPPRPTSPRCSATSRRSSPTLLIVDSVQTIAAADVEGVAGGVTQVARGRRGADPAWPRSATSPPCWSATSPRTARSPARACSSTSSTWCCHFEGERHLRCGWCAR